MAEFKYSIYNCTYNLGVCCTAICTPNIIAGQNAKYVGDNCLVYGGLSTTFLGIFSRALTREKIRKKHSVKVSEINKFFH